MYVKKQPNTPQQRHTKIYSKYSILKCEPGHYVTCWYALNVRLGPCGKADSNEDTTQCAMQTHERHCMLEISLHPAKHVEHGKNSVPETRAGRTASLAVVQLTWVSGP